MLGQPCGFYLRRWSCLLPLGRVWSVDAARGCQYCRGRAGSVVSGAAAAGLTLQVVLMYWGVMLNRCAITGSLALG